ncbi:MAG: NifU N-terminal domain-containing protein, partial [Myxococcales bacterium]|nr:NifU N-terminal domain-containing protein [Myxococcales bacterium]
MDLAFRMHAERTPNPHSIKWVLGRTIVEDSITAHFDSAPTPDVSPLADALFQVQGVSIVFFASNFVTVTKRDDGSVFDWIEVTQSLFVAP